MTSNKIKIVQSAESSSLANDDANEWNPSSAFKVVSMYWKHRRLHQLLLFALTMKHFVTVDERKRQWAESRRRGETIYIIEAYVCERNVMKIDASKRFFLPVKARNDLIIVFSRQRVYFAIKASCLSEKSFGIAGLSSCRWLTGSFG